MMSRRLSLIVHEKSNIPEHSGNKNPVYVKSVLNEGVLINL